MEPHFKGRTGPNFKHYKQRTPKWDWHRKTGIDYEGWCHGLLYLKEFSLVVLDLKQEKELVLRSCVWRWYQRRSLGNRTGLSSLYGHHDGGKETETTTTLMEEAKKRNRDIEQTRGTRREKTSPLLLVVRATVHFCLYSLSGAWGSRQPCISFVRLRPCLIEKLFTVKSCHENTLHSFCPTMLSCSFFVLYQRQRKVIGAIAVSRDQGWTPQSNLWFW